MAKTFQFALKRGLVQPVNEVGMRILVLRWDINKEGSDIQGRTVAEMIRMVLKVCI